MPTPATPSTPPALNAAAMLAHEKEGGRMAAVGVKKEGFAYFDDLSEDMQELVSNLFEDAGVEIPKTVPTRAVAVDRFPDVGLATGTDDRGIKHANDMAGQYLPPVVVNGDVWMDGRHRIHHLKSTGVEWMLAIDLAGLLPAPNPGEPMHLGVLKPIVTVVDTPEKHDAFALNALQTKAASLRDAALGAIDQLTTPKNKDRPMTVAKAASTPAEHAMVFASMGESTLLEHIRTRAQVQDTMALAAAFDSGIFDMRPAIDAEPKLVVNPKTHKFDKNEQKAANARMDEITDSWAPRISAVTAFLRNGTKETFAIDPVLGAMKTEMSMLVLGATPEFKSLFDKIALDAVDQMHWVLGSSNHSGAIRLGGDPMDESFALLTAGAVVLNLPHVATKILDMIPDSAVTCFDSSLLGPVFEDLLVIGRDYQVNATGVALQFSRVQCLEAIKTSGKHGNMAPPDMLLGKEKHEDQSKEDFRNVFFASNMCEPRFAMHCTPTAFRFGVEDALKSDKQDVVDSVQKSALDAIDNNSMLHPYVLSFLAAGCFDKNPTEAVRCAAIYGLENVVREAGNPPRMGNGWPEAGRLVRRVKWNDLAEQHPRNEGTLVKTLKALGDGREDCRESALAFVQRAKEEGQVDKAIGLYSSAAFDDETTPVRAEPLYQAVLQDMPKLVIAMLDSGISATEPIFPNQPTVLDMAETLDKPGVAHAIRAWGLRETARKLMDDLGNAKSKAAP